MDCNFSCCYNHSMPSVPLTVCPTCFAQVTSLIVDFATQRRFCQECATTSSTAVRVARKIHEHNMRGTLKLHGNPFKLQGLAVATEFESFQIKFETFELIQRGGQNDAPS